ncbi:MAG: hypothetical protein Kow006_02110 [Gammaproteobacteria bacterium]
MKEILTLPLEEVWEGAELARDLADGHGRTLMKQGAVLNPRMLELLANRGVERVEVYAAEVMDEAELQARRDEIRERVERRFAAVGQSEVMAKLKAVVLEFRLEVLR